MKNYPNESFDLVFCPKKSVEISSVSTHVVARVTIESDHHHHRYEMKSHLLASLATGKKKWADRISIAIAIEINGLILLR